jgi:hypothetical protein
MCRKGYSVALAGDSAQHLLPVSKQDPETACLALVERRHLLCPAFRSQSRSGEQAPAPQDANIMLDAFGSHNCLVDADVQVHKFVSDASTITEEILLPVRLEITTPFLPDWTRLGGYESKRVALGCH